MTDLMSVRSVTYSHADHRRRELLLERLHRLRKTFDIESKPIVDQLIEIEDRSVLSFHKVAMGGS